MAGPCRSVHVLISGLRHVNPPSPLYRPRVPNSFPVTSPPSPSLSYLSSRKIHTKACVYLKWQSTRARPSSRKSQKLKSGGRYVEPRRVSVSVTPRPKRSPLLVPTPKSIQDSPKLLDHTLQLKLSRRGAQSTSSILPTSKPRNYGPCSRTTPRTGLLPIPMARECTSLHPSGSCAVSQLCAVVWIPYK